MKKRDILFCLFLLIYAILGCSYAFFSEYKLNRMLTTTFGFAHLYSFFTMICLVMLLFSLLAAAITLLKNGFKLKFDTPNSILISSMVFSMLFIFGGTGTDKLVETNRDGQTIRLVEWNVADNINEANIRGIFGEFDADIAVFPELGGYEKGDHSNSRLINLFKKAGIDFEKYEVYVSDPTEGSIAPVTIVIKRAFGRYNFYKKTPMTRFGTVYLSPTTKGKPSIIGLHTAPPLPGLMGIWKNDLDLISDLSKHNKDSIIIGDFNATMKHGRLNTIKTHVDALEHAPKFNSGTWNIDIPSPFRTRIDHILIPNNKYGVKSIELKAHSNSDHLCVFTEIQELTN